MIAVGVDTHKHEHVAAALNELGELLGEIVVAASPAGYRELVKWLRSLGEGVMVGIEGAGSYGAGLCKYLQDAGVQVLEVECPRRRDRRTGKSDRIDALLAAKKVLAGEGLSSPKASGTCQARLRGCWSRRRRDRRGCDSLAAPLARFVARNRIRRDADLMLYLCSVSPVGVKRLTVGGGKSTPLASKYRASA